MTKSIAGVLLSGFFALLILGGCAAPEADVQQKPPEAIQTAAQAEPTATPTATATIETDTQAATPKPDLTESVKPMATPRPEASSVKTRGGNTASTEDSGVEKNTGNNSERSEVITVPDPAPAPVQPESIPTPPPAPVAIPPAPTPEPVPEPTPAPDPTPVPGAKCHICKTMIPDSELVAHMEYHALHDGGGGWDTE